MRRKWALFLSGRGSTAQALLDLAGDLDIRLAVSSRPRAAGLLRARRAGVPTRLFLKDMSWFELDEDLRRRGIEGILLVGFMRLLPCEFVERWRGRVWNIHPSLLPEFPGAQAMEKSFVAGGAMGVTLHEVTAEMDAGRPVLRAAVDRHEDWNVARLRMARAEQRLLREWAQRADLQMGRS